MFPPRPPKHKYNSSMVGLEMVLFCAGCTWRLTPASSQVPHNSVLTSFPVGWRVDWEEWNLIGEGNRGDGGYKGSHLLPLTSRLIPCHALNSAHFVRCLPFLNCHYFFFNSQASCYIIWNTAFVTIIFSSQLLTCLHLNGCKRELSKVRLDQKALQQPSTAVKILVSYQQCLNINLKHNALTSC